MKPFQNFSDKRQNIYIFFMTKSLTEPAVFSSIALINIHTLRIDITQYKLLSSVYL